jgi:hypothetical protein
MILRSIAPPRRRRSCVVEAKPVAKLDKRSTEVVLRNLNAPRPTLVVIK